MDLLYTIADALTRFMNGGPGLLPSLVLLVAAGIPVTLLHELGHAVVARRLLDTGVEVSVGTTGRLLHLQLGRIDVAINALARPDRVGGSAQFDAARATARDVVLIALAGPAASFAGLLVCVWALPATGGVVHDLVWAAIATSACGVLNLIPLTLQERRNGPPVRSDGRLALDALRVMRQIA